MSSKDVFISYGREPDVVLFVKQLKKDLEINGINVWVDTDDIPLGTDWRAEITTGVDSCRIFIPIISQKYLSSRYCVNELYAADNDQKIIFPIIFSDVDFNVSDSSKGIKFIINSINWTMCRPGIDNYGQSLEKMIQAMKNKAFVKPPDFELPGTTEEIAGKIGEMTVTDGASATVLPHSGSVQFLPKSTRPIKTILGIKNPNGIAISNDKKILITMMESNEVWVFSEDYEKIGTIGGEGVEEGKFYCPFGITVDHDNNVIITCAALQCIQKFSIDGRYINSAGKPGKGEFELQSPNGVAVSKDGKIYVCDLGNNRIQILNGDLQFLGNFSLTDPEYGSGTLNNPNGIAIKSNGDVLVSDMLSHCIQVFSADGKFLSRISKQGYLGGCLTSPMAITIDDDDNIYVADGICRISVFASNGMFVRVFGGNGAELGQFGLIRGIAIDTDKKLYVCEWQNNRVQIFQ